MNYDPMMDSLFPFIDPIFELTDDNFSQFVVHIDDFLASQKAGGHVCRQLTESDYKEMWMLRYQQHLGTISFMELLEKYEVILGIPPKSF